MAKVEYWTLQQVDCLIQMRRTGQSYASIALLMGIKQQRVFDKIQKLHQQGVEGLGVKSYARYKAERTASQRFGSVKSALTKDRNRESADAIAGFWHLKDLMAAYGADGLGVDKTATVNWSTAALNVARFTAEANGQSYMGSPGELCLTARGNYDARN